MAFSNKGRLVKRGDHVIVQIGQFQADGLVVEQRFPPPDRVGADASGVWHKRAIASISARDLDTWPLPWPMGRVHQRPGGQKRSIARAAYHSR